MNAAATLLFEAPPRNRPAAKSDPKNSRRIKKSLERKYKCDRLIAGLLLVPALPTMGVLWSLVKMTSRGPGIYKQRRVGSEGREFFIYKLRTMTADCEKNTGAVWAKPNDPRVTSLGRLLRATHLDELPQLFNVLKGEMSMVGPRPERLEIISWLSPQVPNYLERLQVKPGVTGLAQLFAPPDLTVEDVCHKLAYDLKYIERRSMWLDLRIMACTFLKCVGLNRPRVRGLLIPEFFQRSTVRKPAAYKGLEGDQKLEGQTSRSH